MPPRRAQRETRDIKTVTRDDGGQWGPGSVRCCIIIIYLRYLRVVFIPIPWYVVSAYVSRVGASAGAKYEPRPPIKEDKKKKYRVVTGAFSFYALISRISARNRFRVAALPVRPPAAVATVFARFYTRKSVLSSATSPPSDLFPLAVL